MISFHYNILIYYFYVIIWMIKILFVYNFISFKNKFKKLINILIHNNYKYITKLNFFLNEIKL